MSYRPARESSLVAPVSQRTAVLILALLPPEEVIWRRTANLPTEVREELLRTLDTLRAAAKLHRRTADNGGAEAAPSADQGSSEVGRSPAGTSQAGEDALSTGGAAKRLRMSPRRVRQLCESGTLAGHKIGGRWLISRSAVEGYEAMKEAAA